MKTKNIVIGCVALVVLGGAIAACGVGGIFMLGLNSEADQAESAGVAFGRGTDQVGCRDEALRRWRAATRANDLLKRRETQLFLNGCFQTSRATPGFCADAPKEDTLLTVRQWSQEQCQKTGAGGDDVCISLFMEVSDSCLGKTKKKAE